MPRVGCAALLAAAALACTSAGSLYKRPWLEVETANFRIVSTLSAEETVELANHLELFRTVVQTVTNIPTADSVIPTRIFVFENEYDFGLFIGESNVAGYFIDGMRATYLAMTAATRIDEARVMRHEYVHFLMNNATSILYPPWYSEGFAEFLSTVTVHEDGEHVIIGAFPTDRRIGWRRGQPMKFEKVISARGGSVLPGNMFYEQSWALVHWLQLGRGRDHVASEEMTRYLDLVAAGHTDVEAFEEAFGLSMKEARGELVVYLRGNYRAVAVPLSAFDHQSAEPRVGAMEADTISVALGQLALVHEDGRTARTLFEAAIAANPANSRAHAGLGDAFKLMVDWEQAEPHFLRAMELGPNDAENQLDYAEYLHDMALRDEMKEQRPELLRQARQRYVRSYKLDPGIPETYAMYGSSFLAPGEDPARGLETLEHAHSLLPSNTYILRLLAQAYVRLDREDHARPLVERIVASSHAGDRADKVDELLAELAATDDEEAAEERDEGR